MEPRANHQQPSTVSQHAPIGPGVVVCLCTPLRGALAPRKASGAAGKVRRPGVGTGKRNMTELMVVGRGLIVM